MEISKKALSQLMAIRDSGETNMFDVRRVREIAMARGYFDLVEYIDQDGGQAYFRLILFGKREDES